MTNHQLLTLAEHARDHYASQKRTFKQEAARVLYQPAIKEAMFKFLTACRKAGYTRITIGKSKEFWVDGGADNMVFAQPKIRRDHRLPLWELTPILGGMGCGNSMSNCDQAQLNLHGKDLDGYHGIYDLNTPPDTWLNHAHQKETTR